MSNIDQLSDREGSMLARSPPPRHLSVTESFVTLPPDEKAIASWPSYDHCAPRAKRELCWRGLPPALLASTFRLSNALRASTFIKLWLTYWPIRWSLSQRTHGYADSCERRPNQPEPIRSERRRMTVYTLGPNGNKDGPFAETHAHDADRRWSTQLARNRTRVGLPNPFRIFRQASKNA